MSRHSHLLVASSLSLIFATQSGAIASGTPQVSGTNPERQASQIRLSPRLHVDARASEGQEFLVSQRKRKFRNTHPTPYYYRPPGKGPFPGAIILHTNGGIRPHIVRFGKKLAKHNYVVAIANYFAKGGVDNIAKAYDRLHNDAKVDPDHIGLVGFSKGSVEALSFAAYSRNFTKRNVSGIVSLYIGPVIPQNDEVYPPILFLHEGITSKVSPEQVNRFCTHQRKMGTVCQTHIYKGTHHGWDTSCPYCKYSGKVTADSYRRTVEFLDQYLKGEAN